ncbi:hypothetical protein RND71_036928 [Anisodus tanguticus]|uniref:Uncharacterized protein n=1 Tax=Anisodus tanguticus TaxID=243964 RepID=A0AAE1R335_9SOLA|nr:hypothetical protein RND71_036928 [Anisodus tanguticus]
MNKIRVEMGELAKLDKIGMGIGTCIDVPDRLMLLVDAMYSTVDRRLDYWYIDRSKARIEIGAGSTKAFENAVHPERRREKANLHHHPSPKIRNALVNRSEITGNERDMSVNHSVACSKSAFREDGEGENALTASLSYSLPRHDIDSRRSALLRPIHAIDWGESASLTAGTGLYSAPRICACGRGEYCGPADAVVDNRSDLVKVVAAPVVGQRTYRDARGPIYDVSVAEPSSNKPRGLAMVFFG